MGVAACGAARRLVNCSLAGRARVPCVPVAAAVRQVRCGAFSQAPSGRQLQPRENRRGARGPHIARAGEERPGGRRAAGARFFSRQ